MINTILIIIILIILFMNIKVRKRSIYILNNNISPYLRYNHPQVNRINKIDNVKRHGYYQSSKNYSRRRSSIY